MSVLPFCERSVERRTQSGNHAQSVFCRSVLVRYRTQNASEQAIRNQKS